MANFKTDSRIVLTLDAGGTNMVFGAMRRGEFIIEPITLQCRRAEQVPRHHGRGLPDRY